ncbi:MAG: DUF3105 domain-containing protein [Chloroflexi bacterium]|nr:DUF3105 domain-containing protein [Chloroflexota bacterium]
MSKRRMLKKQEETAVTSNNRQWWYIGGALGGVVVIALFALMVQAAVPTAAPRPTATPVADIPGLVQAPSPPSGEHDDNLQISFGELPPFGGPHNSVWQNCGIYVNPVRPEHAVHALEHGAVWITYQPDLAEAELSALTARVRSRNYVLVSPYPEQRSPIVLTAWGIQLELEDSADERFLAFLDAFEQGPQTPEPGGACSGGLGFTTGS